MKILYFGPIAKKGQPSIGGYEAANRKNIDALRKKGIEVVEFPNPVVNRKWGLLGKFVYVKLFFLPFKLWKYRNDKTTIVHTTYLHSTAFILPNALLSRTLGYLKIKNVLDIRAGSFLDLYENGGFLYRKLTDVTLKHATCITVEGKKYLDGVPRVSGIRKSVAYFPNLFDCSSIKTGTHRPNPNKISLFYFGRITEEKGSLLLLELIDILPENYRLYLAGGCTDPKIRARITDNKKTTYLGKLNRQQLQTEMSRMTFFVFPTRHQGEGQSNSLIEAMGEGLIPITSDQGFCADVVNGCGSVLPTYASAEDYRACITDWVHTKDLEAASKRCQEHIFGFHNINTEIDKLIGLYKSIL